MTKVVIVVVIYVIALTASTPQNQGPYPGFILSYGVNDVQTGNNFAHQQTRDDGTTTGEYRVALPDGRVQVVKYTADDKGYRAKVSYEGVAVHPDDADKSQGTDSNQLIKASNQKALLDQGIRVFPEDFDGDSHGFNSPVHQFTGIQDPIHEISQRDEPVLPRPVPIQHSGRSNGHDFLLPVRTRPDPVPPKPALITPHVSHPNHFAPVSQKSSFIPAISRPNHIPRQFGEEDRFFTQGPPQILHRPHFTSQHTSTPRITTSGPPHPHTTSHEPHFETSIPLPSSPPQFVTSRPTQSSPHFISGPPHSSPHFTTSAPQHIHSAPHFTAPNPQHIHSAPHFTTPAPQHIHSAPHFTTPAPQHIHSAPHFTTPNPQHIHSAPHFTTSRPPFTSNAPHSPKSFPSSSPHFTMPAPPVTLPSPHFNSLGPHITTPIPHHNSPPSRFSIHHLGSPVNHLHDPHSSLAQQNLAQQQTFFPLLSNQGLTNNPPLRNDLPPLSNHQGGIGAPNPVTLQPVFLNNRPLITNQPISSISRPIASHGLLPKEHALNSNHRGVSEASNFVTPQPPGRFNSVFNFKPAHPHQDLPRISVNLPNKPNTDFSLFVPQEDFHSSQLPNIVSGGSQGFPHSPGSAIFGPTVPSHVSQASPIPGSNSGSLVPGIAFPGLIITPGPVTGIPGSVPAVPRPIFSSPGSGNTGGFPTTPRVVFGGSASPRPSSVHPQGFGQGSRGRGTKRLRGNSVRHGVSGGHSTPKNRNHITFAPHFTSFPIHEINSGSLEHVSPSPQFQVSPTPHRFTSSPIHSSELGSSPHFPSALHHSSPAPHQFTSPIHDVTSVPHISHSPHVTSAPFHPTRHQGINHEPHDQIDFHPSTSPPIHGSSPPFHPSTSPPFHPSTSTPFRPSTTFPIFQPSAGPPRARRPSRKKAFRKLSSASHSTTPAPEFHPSTGPTLHSDSSNVFHPTSSPLHSAADVPFHPTSFPSIIHSQSPSSSLIHPPSPQTIHSPSAPSFIHSPSPSPSFIHSPSPSPSIIHSPSPSPSIIHSPSPSPSFIHSPSPPPQSLFVSTTPAGTFHPTHPSSPSHIHSPSPSQSTFHSPQGSNFLPTAQGTFHPTSTSGPLLNKQPNHIRKSTVPRNRNRPRVLRRRKRPRLNRPSTIPSFLPGGDTLDREKVLRHKGLVRRSPLKAKKMGDGDTHETEKTGDWSPLKTKKMGDVVAHESKKLGDGVVHQTKKTGDGFTHEESKETRTISFREAQESDQNNESLYITETSEIRDSEENEEHETHLKENVNPSIPNLKKTKAIPNKKLAIIIAPWRKENENE